jgi:hypothetical protein
MSKSDVARGLAGLLLSAVLAQAQDQPPPLEPPALVPPATAAPAATTTTTTPAAARPRVAPAKPLENRSLLVIPGVTAPVPPRPGVRLVPPRASADTASPTGRTPTATPGVAKPTRTVESLARPAPSPTTAAPIPLTLEAIPDDPPAELGSERLPADLRESKRSTRPAAPPTSSSILGRLLGPSSPNEDTAPPRSSITVEPHSDPAAEAALKRRIQKQVEQMLGDHVRSVEVRVTGRTVVFRAHASRFWYRRSVRRGLETMPLPAGYHARVEAVD